MLTVILRQKDGNASQRKMKGKQMKILQVVKSSFHKAVGFGHQVWNTIRKPVGIAMQSAAAVAVVATFGVFRAHAQTDMSSAITTVSGYWNTIYPIGVAIVVFLVGRKIVKKL
jgi:hypothetical protein